MIKRRAPFLFYMLLFIACIVFIILKANNYRENVRGREVQANNGVFDFSKEIFDAHKLYPLRGKVAFYWHQLFSPSDFSDSSDYKKYDVKIPDIWNHYNLDNISPKGKGYATYRFKILVPDNKEYGISIKELETAYKIWVNDKFAEIGKVSDKEQEIVPSWKRLNLFVHPVNKVLNVTIQIANSQHRKGGLEDVILLGSAKSIMNNKIQADATEYVILGILLISFLYYFGLFLFDYKDHASLYFSLLNLSIAFRLLLTGEKLMLVIFPDISWLFSLRLEYLTIAVPTTLGLFFIHEIYSNFFLHWIPKVKLIILTVFTLIVFIFPPQVFTYMTLIYQPIIFISVLYVAYVLIRAMINRDRNAPFLLAGLAIFSALVINDVLFYDNIIHTGYLLPYGAIILIFSFSYGLSGRYAQAQRDTVRLKSELEVYSHDLERIVEQRTKEIHDQKELLQEQTNKLSEANTKLKSLMEYRDMMTNMVIHDMKTPLSAVTNLNDDAGTEFIRLARQSGHQLYNLVQNLLELHRYDEAKLDVTAQETNLNSIIEAAYDQVSYFFELKNMDFNSSVKQTETIICDQFLVERILVNMLFNALKFTEDNGQISINCEKLNGFKKISVTDTGCGVSSEFHEKIFERFTQVTKKEQKKTSTGLGLAFCKIAVEAHHGKIGVISELEKGSTFWFTLPDKV